MTPSLQRRADTAIQQLRVNPHHPSLRTHKRAGEGNLWQARVTRSYRLYFELHGDTITLIDVGPHEK
ncbi:MAG: hypothetical protein HUU16_17775 [Candidatus Omnitrophica bacterium]|nr:hypothetical protein [Candidatus Omnitrophota bacterium]